MEAKKIVVCPRCNLEMVEKEARKGPPIFFCVNCQWAICSWHWMVEALTKEVIRESLPVH